tara:strand:+ start:3145 stop:3564 length:420 start_codon:yes stop_codon:yes gene_type:complete
MKLPTQIKKVVKQFEKQSDMLKVVIALVVIYGIYYLCKEMRWTVGSGSYLEGFATKTFVFFRMNGCGHCEDMKPEWAKFKSSYTGDVEIKEVEQSDMTDQQKTWVKGFPTLVLVENDAVVKTYDGERTSAGFTAFLKAN